MTGGHDPTPPQGVPLQEILRRLDPGFVLPLSGPDPETVPVRAVAIHDPTAGQHAPDGILLAPGIDLAEDPTPLALLAANDVAAVVIRGSTVPPEAAESPTSVLSLDPSIAWEQAFLLLAAALDAALGDALGAPLGSSIGRVGDLFALADAISTSVGGSVLILDARNRVLAFSGSEQPIDEWRQGTILGRRVPKDWEQRFRREGVYDEVRKPGSVVTFTLPDNPDFRPRRAIGVQAGGRVIGALAVAEGDVPFDEGTDDTLREAARMASLHLLRHSTREAFGAHRQDERVRELLAGEGTAGSAIPRLGLGTGQPFAVIAVAQRSGTDAALDDLGPLLRMRLSHEAEIVSVVDGPRLYILAAAPEEVLSRLSSDPGWFTDSAAARRGFVAGVSRPVDRAEDVGAAREEADRVVDAMAREIVRLAVASLEQTWPHLVLAQAERLMLTEEAMLYGRAAQLAVHDRSHQTDYVATLACFLRYRGDSSRTADALHIHPNTLRYRVRRACEIAGIALDDPTERLVLELQLSALSRP